jgi:uncharacterized protein YjbI with pentapeptide repeats
MRFPLRPGWLSAAPFALLLAATPALAQASGTVPDSVAQKALRARVEMEKLRAERDKARAETRNLNNPFVLYAPYLTLLGAIAGGLLGWAKYVDERRDARRQALHERVAAALQQLGAAETPARIAAAASLGLLATAAEGELPTLRRQVIDSLCGLLGQSGVQGGEQAAFAATLSRLAAGQKGLDRLPLAGADLRRVSFDGAEIIDTDFSGCTLESTSFRTAALRRGTLNGLSQPAKAVDFSGAALESVHFGGATLEDVSFHGAAVNDLVFENCSLVGCGFTSLKTGARLRFVACRVFSSDFTGSDLSGLSISALQDVDPSTAKSLAGAAGFANALLDDASRARVAAG